MILSFARSQVHGAGTGTRQQGPLPLWWFLLPHPEASSISVVGSPTRHSRRVAELPIGPGGDHGATVPYVTVGADPAQRHRAGRDGVAVVEGLVPPADLEGRRALWVPDRPLPPEGVAAVLARGRRVGNRLARRIGRRSAPAALAADAAALHPTEPHPATTHTILSPPDGHLGRLPAYLHHIARTHGHEVGDTAWWVVPPRGYRQQKVLFMTATDGTEGLPVAAKVTQDPDHNVRLDNEYEGLRRVWDGGWVPPETIPRPLFADRHAGLSVVGEEAVAGTTFSRGVDPLVRHPRFEQVLRWIGMLGAGSSHPVAGTDMAAALTDVAGLLERLYGRADLVAVLHRDAERVAAAGAVPAVFGHGDLGFWNTVVRDDETVVVCDWENSETSSPPLWDLVYFVQTYGAWAAQVSGTRYGPRTFRQQLLDPASSWATWLWGTAAEHAEDLGLSSDLFVPMARSFWAYQAVKEASRLDPRRLARGRYIRMLEVAASIDRPPVA